VQADEEEIHGNGSAAAETSSPPVGKSAMA
jgi:hypothetical protein